MNKAEIQLISNIIPIFSGCILGLICGKMSQLETGKRSCDHEVIKSI